MPNRIEYPDLLAKGKTPSLNNVQVQKALGFAETNSINALARQDPGNHRYLPSYINPPDGEGWRLAGPNTNYQRFFFPEHVEIWEKHHPQMPRGHQKYFKKVDQRMIDELLPVAREMADSKGRVNRRKLHAELQARYPGRWSRHWYQAMAEILDSHGIPATRQQPQSSRRAS